MMKKGITIGKSKQKDVNVNNVEGIEMGMFVKMWNKRILKEMKYYERK